MNHLVLLHGFCEDSRVWNTFKTGIDPNWQVHTPDLPGFGNTPLSQQEMTIMDYAEFVKQYLDEASIKQCVLVGHSMGGYVALANAERYAAHLIGLGLFHSHAYADSPEKQANRTKAIEFIGKHGTAPFAKELVPALFAPEFRAQHQDVVNAQLQDALTCSPEGLMVASQAMRDRPDRVDVLRNLALPLLVILGDADGVIPMEMGKEQVAGLDHATVEVLEGVGHMGMMEAKEGAINIINSFLNQF